ncbi:hypothetical protein [Streptosporangium sandarakinum]
MITAWKAAHSSINDRQGAYETREIINAIFHQGRTCCQWNFLVSFLRRSTSRADLTFI